MYEFEGTLKGFLNKMLKVVFYLLCPLNIEYHCQYTAAAINICGSCFFIFHHLFNKTQVAAYTSHFRIQLHAAVHLEKSIFVRPDSHIYQRCVLWLELLTKTIEKPVM